VFNLATIRRSLALFGIGLLLALIGCQSHMQVPPQLASRSTSQPTSQPVERAGVAVYVDDDMVLDYKPDPTLVTKVTPITKPKFPVIDSHCHWFMVQSPQLILAAMDRLGVEKAVNLSGGWGKQLDQLLEKFHKASPERLLIFCNVDFSKIDDPNFAVDTVHSLEDARRKGVSGLKVFKNLGLTTHDRSGHLIAIDDPRLDPIWDACGRLGMPVLIHSGDPQAFFQPIDRKNERWMQLRRHPDWSFYGPQYPTYDEVLAQHIRMISRHPKTIFISAHLANSGDDLEKLGRWLRENPNMYTDLSGRVPELGRQPFAGRRFLIEFQDRVLFGTDRYPGRPDQPRELIYYRYLETDDEYFNYYDNPFPTEGEWRIYGAYLPDDVLKKIYHDNAERALHGLAPVVPSTQK
jgi:predicted TIM-barrel fold metal-dependent hydrolase